MTVLGRAFRRIAGIRQWTDQHFADRNGLRRARRSLERAERFYDVRIADALRAGLSGDDLEAERYSALFEIELARDELASLMTTELLAQARRRMLPIPAIGEASPYWERSPNLGTWRFTNAGITTLKDEIRRDRKEEWELRLAAGSLVVGILGVATALAAILVSH